MRGESLSRHTDRGAPKKFAAELLDAISSVWLGITLATLLFFYCSIGSAIPAVRQHPLLEMTEFEWFHWWPFNVLILLFCTTLVMATLRRIPLRTVNAGVWMIHTGIILLCAGSYWYFSTKVEGDAPVFRRKVTISMPGMKAPEEMVAVPGSEKTVTVGPDNWHFKVQSTNTVGPILSEGDAGKRAYAVNVMVQPPFGDPFVRQLLAGYPQYTEDVIPGKGRAIKETGSKLVKEDLKLGLDFHPTTHFHVMDTWALFVRRVGDSEWHERPIEGLPRYNDRIGSRDQVFSDPHFPLALRPLDLNVPAAAGGDALADASVHVTGFLRYAHMDRHWREGSELNPVVQLSLVSTQAPARDYELIAFDAQRSRTPDGNIQFLWLPDRSEVAKLPVDSRALLKISVPETKTDVEVLITQDKIGGDFVGLGSSEFAYRINAVHDDLALPNREQPISVVAVEFKTPDGQFRRIVSSAPELTKDLLGETSDPHSVDARAPDPRIVTSYQPQTPPILFAAYPGGLHFVFNGPKGRLVGRDVSEGEVIQLFEDLSLRVEGFHTHAVADVKPFVVPPPRQQAKMGQNFSMARVEVQTRRGVESQWLNFARYVFPDDDYAMGGRFAYAPAVFQTDDGPVEVMLSRRRVPLPKPIAMEDFKLDTHLGGFTGNALTIRNYISRLRFLDGGKWTEPVDIAVNAPTEFGGYWYFQSEWDRPEPNQAGGGMNFTGLGIGNRHGVHLQLLGCCIAVAGMIFAFYVKPVIKRRGLRSRSKLSAENEPGEVPHVSSAPAVGAVEIGAMNTRFRIRWIDALVVLGIVGYGGYRAAHRPAKTAGPSEFARQVNLDPLYHTAVQADGRLRSFESHAKTYIGGYVTGPRAIAGQTNGFTYLDLIFRPENYADTDLIFVKNKEVREQILDALLQNPQMTPERHDAILKSGQFSRTMLADPAVVRLLQKLGEDLIRTSKVVDAINSAMTVADAGFLTNSLRIVAPPGGELDKLWVSVPESAGDAGMARGARNLAVLAPELKGQLVEAWNSLGDAWRNQDAATVNRQLVTLASLLPTVSPSLYPSPGRLAMESWYFRYSSMTWVWLFYLASVIPLLMSVIYHWDWARKTGMVLFFIAFLAQTVSIGVRWYISGRWPNANMFEALTTSSWFGAVGAMILERLARHTPLRNLFALGSSIVSMTALMAAYFLPAELDSGINNKMAALNDVWLYIHTNMIISSYAVIGLACVPGLLLLRDRWCKTWDSGVVPRLRLRLLPIALGVLNYTAYVLLMRAMASENTAYSSRQLWGIGGAFCGSLVIILLEALAAGQRARSGVGRQRSASGGAASLLGGAAGFLREDKPTSNQIFDGATMVLVELSFIMLWTGLVMGAIWADHSWGRPWGWDPKEVFALNTFLIFLVLIHVRLKVRDKAFWTAILAVVGFEVMMFNWIVVNFVISGLHSYA